MGQLMKAIVYHGTIENCCGSKYIEKQLNGSRAQPARGGRLVKPNPLKCGFVDVMVMGKFSGNRDSEWGFQEVGLLFGRL